MTNTRQRPTNKDCNSHSSATPAKIGTKLTSDKRKIAELSDLMFARLPALAARITEEVRAIGGYREMADTARDDIHENCINNVTFILRRLLDGESGDLHRAQHSGRSRAIAGIPLESVMTAYRIGFRRIWEEIVALARKRGIAADLLLDASVDIFLIQDEFTQAMCDAYRRQQMIQILDQEEERSALVEAVLYGRISDQGGFWKAADILNLPAVGPYVVVAAQIPSIGKLALTEITSKLAASDIHSAWRLGPDLQVGIVHLREREKQYPVLVEVLTSAASGPVGLSPSFDNLSEAGCSLRLARIAVTSQPRGPGLVRGFDDAPLSSAAVSAPEVMVRIEENILRHVNDLPDKHRALLIDTFQAWLDARGSANDAAVNIFCHPNTVRHRLHRIEELTGRSLSNPRDMAELCLAFEIERQRPT
jgi:hypothetical protein